jgi:hypothetical protein
MIATITQKVIGVAEQFVIEVAIIGTGFSVSSGGSGSDSTIIQKIASGDIGGHRVVCSFSNTQAEYATKDDLNKSRSVLGITQGASSDGELLTIQSAGEITEGSWNWTPQQFVYLSTNGLLTQTAPSTGFLLIIGFAVSATKIAINIGHPISLT